MPPPPTEACSPDDWFPYGSCVGFETAEFLYACKKMSAADIDFLCQLWAATLIGGVPWQSATFQYDGPRPADDAPTPTWMEFEYTIWFRDPSLLFNNMLENSEFAAHFDYVPHQQYDPKGFRRYENFMSGDWAWKQAVTIVLMCHQMVKD